MRPLMWLAILLIALGVIGFARGGFTYTKDTDKAKLGPIEIQVKDKERVRVSPALSGLSLVGGVVLAVYAARRK